MNTRRTVFKQVGAVGTGPVLLCGSVKADYIGNTNEKQAKSVAVAPDQVPAETSLKEIKWPSVQYPNSSGAGVHWLLYSYIGAC